MSGRFIVAEGIDLAGKSDVCKALVELTGAVLVKTPTPPVDAQRSFYDECGDLQARFLFYLTSNIVAGNEIRKLLETSDVICDRFIHSTLVNHEALGVDTSIVNIEALDLPKPDLTFLLVVDEDVRLERKKARGEPEKPIEAILPEVNRLLRERIPVQIDTTHTTPPRSSHGDPAIARVGLEQLS